MILLNKDEIKSVFSMKDAIEADKECYRAFSEGKFDVPQRAVINGSCGGIISQVGPDRKQQFRLRYFDPKAVPEITASDTLAAANRSYNNDVPLPWTEEIIPLDEAYAIDFYGKVYEYYGQDKAPYVPIAETLYVMELIDRCHKDAEST